MEHRAGSQVIKAIVPLAEMFGYATHMRSRTQGRAEFSMHFARYEEVPRSVAEEIIGKVAGQGHEIKQVAGDVAGHRARRRS